MRVWAQKTRFPLARASGFKAWVFSHGYRWSRTIKTRGRMEKRLVTIRLLATCVPNSIALPLPFLLRKSGHEAKGSGPLLPPLLLGGGDQVAWATPRRIENVPRQFPKRPCLTIPVDSPQGVCEGLTFKTVSPRAEDTYGFQSFRIDLCGGYQPTAPAAALSWILLRADRIQPFKLHLGSAAGAPSGS